MWVQISAVTGNQQAEQVVLGPFEPTSERWAFPNLKISSFVSSKVVTKLNVIVETVNKRTGEVMGHFSPEIYYFTNQNGVVNRYSLEEAMAASNRVIAPVIATTPTAEQSRAGLVLAVGNSLPPEDTVLDEEPTGWEVK